MSDLALMKSSLIAQKPNNFLASKAFVPLIFLVLLVFAPKSGAAQPQSSLNRLKNGFFPAYLTPAFQKYLGGSPTGCASTLDQIKINAYSKDPEKYYLLKALCSAKEQQPDSALKNIELALREKGSSSDILYAAALVLAEVTASEEALKRYSEAIWFNSFKAFQEKDFYYDFGTYQYQLQLFGEAKASLEKSQVLGNTSLETKVMLAEIALRSGDRRNGILLSKQVVALKKNTENNARVVRALMLFADPVFHKREITEAVSIASKLGPAALLEPEVCLSATKAYLMIKDDAKAKEVLVPCFAVNAADPRLQALDEQIKQGETLESQELES